MAKRYFVTLTEEERGHLLGLTKKGKVSARKLTRAHILLQADAGVPDKAIAAALHIGIATVERLRKRLVEEGLDAALSERPRPGGQRKLDGKQEAFLVALACSTPPRDGSAGRCSCWPTHWLQSRWLRPSRTKRCAAPSKKHAQTVAEGSLVHSHGQCRVRVAHGRHPRLVCRAL
jgi:transposase